MQQNDVVVVIHNQGETIRVSKSLLRKLRMLQIYNIWINNRQCMITEILSSVFIAFFIGIIGYYNDEQQMILYIIVPLVLRYIISTYIFSNFVMSQDLRYSPKHTIVRFAQYLEFAISAIASVLITVPLLRSLNYIPFAYIMLIFVISKLMSTTAAYVYIHLKAYLDKRSCKSLDYVMLLTIMRIQEEHDIEILTYRCEMEKTKWDATNTEKECCVCLTDFTVSDTITKLQCNHCFHNNCAEPWLLKNPTCPKCRHVIPSYVTFV
jgi:hypothetical protein